VRQADLCIDVLGVDVRICRDPRFELSQITWRTTGAHHPTEDTPQGACRKVQRCRIEPYLDFKLMDDRSRSPLVT